jgi:hypothetical protein
MGANKYRLISGFATESTASASDEPMTDEGSAIAELATASKVVFSSTLKPSLSWPNTRLISGDAVEAVAAMTQDGTSPMRTLGSLILCRSLLEAGLVDACVKAVGDMLRLIDLDLDSAHVQATMPSES